MWAMFQMIIVSSFELDANKLPFELIATLLTQSLWPLSVYTQKPEVTSHILIVLSLEAENKKSPPGMNSTQDTSWSCPCNVLNTV